MAPAIPPIATTDTTRPHTTKCIQSRLMLWITHASSRINDFLNVMMHESSMLQADMAQILKHKTDYKINENSQNQGIGCT
jgi:hypothetical protein